MSKKSNIWMPLYVGDYLGDTIHLTTEQHGAYFLLIMACWMRGGTLPDDDAQLAAMAKMSPKAWRSCSRRVRDFFTLGNGVLTHKRVVAETEKARNLSEIRAEVGRRGGRPKKQTETNRFPEPKAKRKQNETPSPSPSRDKPIEGLSPTHGETPILPFGRQSTPADAGSPRLSKEDLVKGMAEIRAMLAVPKEERATRAITRAAAGGG